MSGPTVRQREVLATYAHLGSYDLAAHQLGVSVQTVKNTLSNAYASLGAANNVDAFVKMGWLHVPEMPGPRRPMKRCSAVMQCRFTEGHSGRHRALQAVIS